MTVVSIFSSSSWADWVKPSVAIVISSFLSRMGMLWWLIWRRVSCTYFCTLFLLVDLRIRIDDDGSEWFLVLRMLLFRSKKKGTRSEGKTTVASRLPILLIKFSMCGWTRM